LTLFFSNNRKLYIWVVVHIYYFFTKTMPLETYFSLNMPIAYPLREEGVIDSVNLLPDHLKLYISQADRKMVVVRDNVQKHQLSQEKAVDFYKLLVRAGRDILNHPIIANNQYLDRFSEGVTYEQARHEMQQFSIFAVHFNAAQAKLLANAPTFEAFEDRLKILLNEYGIPYEQGGFEGELTGKWNLKHNHFMWILNSAEGLDLGFKDVGKINFALPGTRDFVDATYEYYANEDQSIANVASFGIENWAANKLWEPWKKAMQKLNETPGIRINLGYITYHDREEKHHAQATINELFDNYREPWFDEDKFIFGAESILNKGIQPYYESQLEHLPGKDESWPNKACE